MKISNFSTAAVIMSIGLSFAACGNLKNSPKNEAASYDVISRAPELSNADFSKACSDLSGVVFSVNNKNYCRRSTAIKTLGTGYSTVYSDFIVGEIKTGNSIYVEGSGAFEVQRDNEVLVVPANKYTLNTKDGTLKLQTTIGNYSNVRAYIVECRNQAMQVTSCPM